MMVADFQKGSGSASGRKKGTRGGIGDRRRVMERGRKWGQREARRVCEKAVQ